MSQSHGSDIVVDALPYIDHGYDEPGVKEAVFAMIEEETKRYKPTKNYLEHLPQLDLHKFETDVLKNEMERLSKGQPMELLNMKRYAMPGPPPGKTTDVNAWNEAVQNSEAQLEHQLTRISNLNLMNKYGAEAWKVYNTVLSQLVSSAQKQLQELKKEIQEINWQRKSAQTTAGEKLKSLEANWVALVSKNYEIERTCLQLEMEVNQLKQEMKHDENGVPENNGASSEQSSA